MARVRSCCVVLVVLGLAVAGQKKNAGGIPYGSPCEENLECSPFGIGAVCKEQRCVCDEGFFLNNTRCLYKRGLGETCHRPEFGCYLQTGGHLNVICENGNCACASGFVPDIKSGECLKVALSFGDVCEIHNQCSSLGAGSHCKEGKCVCDGDSFFNGIKCLYKKALGEFCNRPEFGCYTQQGRENTVCRDGSCACAEGFVTGGYQWSTCVKLADTVGSPCTENLQCSSFRGICGRYQRCDCGDSAFFNGSTCLIAKSLNDECRQPYTGCYLEDFRGGHKSVVCRSGTCKCADGYTEEDNYRCNYGGQQLSLSLLTLMVAVGTSLAASRHDL